MKLTQTEQLVLGIVAEQPRHAYEIEKLISERGIRKWADIGFSSIYYVLDKLAAKGLAVAEEAAGKSKRQVTISPLGLSVLKTGACDLIAQRHPANTHFMTGLALSDQLESERLNEALRQRRDNLSADLAAIEIVSRVDTSLSPSARRLFGLSFRLIDAELNWIKEEIERLER